MYPCIHSLLSMQGGKTLEESQAALAPTAAQIHIEARKSRPIDFATTLIGKLIAATERILRKNGKMLLSSPSDHRFRIGV